MSQSKENAIRDKRTIDATKNNLMGPSGKFGTILHAFGNQVVSQGTGLFDTNYLEETIENDDVYTEYSPTLSEQEGTIAYRGEILDLQDENTYSEGIVFDGLSRGIHLEIMYWHLENEIKVTYKGFLVYHEIAGALNAYAPFDDWEKPIERLYISAKEKLKKTKIEKEKNIVEETKKRKNSFFQEMRLRWGI